MLPLPKPISKRSWQPTIAAIACWSLGTTLGVEELLGMLTDEQEPLPTAAMPGGATDPELDRADRRNQRQAD